MPESLRPTALALEEGPKAAGRTRRLFLSGGLVAVGTTYLGAILYPVYRYLAAPGREAAALAAIKEVELEGAERLSPGSMLMFKFGIRPAMLLHHTDGTWTCLDAVCTHLGCTVRFEAEKSRIFCACHGGVYDPRTGANLAGPPPKPLRAYRVEIGDGRIVVSRT